MLFCHVIKIKMNELHAHAGLVDNVISKIMIYDPREIVNKSSHSLSHWEPLLGHRGIFDVSRGNNKTVGKLKTKAIFDGTQV